MTRPGYRFGVRARPRNGDLVRKAVVVGAVLAAAVVLLAALTVVWAPSENGTRQASGVEGFVGPAMAKKDKHSKGDSDSEDKSDKSSDSKDDSGSDSGNDGSSGSGHSKKKGGSSHKSGKSSHKSRSSSKSGSSKSGSSKSRSSDDSSSDDSSGSSSSPSSSSSDGSSTDPGPTGTGNSGSGRSTGGNDGAKVHVSCTKEVTDEAGLKEALASAGPNDVICVKGGLDRGPAATATPTPSSSAPESSPAPSSPTPLGLPAPSGGPTSICGHPEDCTQSNTSSGPSTDAGSSGSQKRTTTQPSGGSTGATVDPASTGLTGPPGATTPQQANCSKQVDGAGLGEAIKGASPGDRICVTGDSTARLEITKGGSDQAPIVIIGNGRTSVKGITVKADNVVVDGFQVLGAQAPGIELTGNNLTAQNNTVKHPTGGDFDGMRFFGNNIKILHNTVADINPEGGSAHADCMQTFTSGKPSSEHVLIDGNRCEKIANICLMAEGPGDVGDGGGGDGTSADWTFSNNFCEFGAGQGVMVEAVQKVTIRNNQFEGKSDKAIGLDLGSTGATVAANLLGEGIDHEVGMDAKSRQGYQGPAPGGGP